MHSWCPVDIKVKSGQTSVNLTHMFCKWQFPVHYTTGMLFTNWNAIVQLFPTIMVQEEQIHFPLDSVHGTFVKLHQLRPNVSWLVVCVRYLHWWLGGAACCCRFTSQSLSSKYVGTRCRRQKAIKGKTKINFDQGRRSLFPQEVNTLK